jgi:hypothetical protein
MPESSSPPGAPEAARPSRKAVLAASAPWLGALLNVLPGLGAGYLYQRRWRAWWITSGLASGWFLLGSQLGTAPAADDPLTAWIGLGGLGLLATLTAAEAFLAARKARMD